LLKDKRNMYIEAYVDEDWDRAKALNEEFKDFQAQRNAILKAKKDQNEELKLKQEELNISTLTKQKEGFKKSYNNLEENLNKEQELQKKKDEFAKKQAQDLEDSENIRLKPVNIENQLKKEREREQRRKDLIIQINKETNEELVKDLNKRIEKEEQLEQQKNDKKIELTRMSFDVLNGVAELFSQGNEADQRKAFQLNKAASLGNAIVNTAQGVTAALTQVPLFPGAQIIQAGLVGTLGALNIAKIANTQFQSSGGGGDTATSTPTAPRTPSFDIIQAQPQMQLGALQQQPVKAYVVSGEVSTAQALDRNRVRNATF
jgi:hypothetical protein